MTRFLTYYAALPTGLRKCWNQYLSQNWIDLCQRRQNWSL